MTSSERNDATPNLITAGIQIFDEVMSRLEITLPERDLLAISTAITKAGLRGFRLGAAFAEDSLRQQVAEAGIDLQLSVRIVDTAAAEPDLWNDQFGSSAQ